MFGFAWTNYPSIHWIVSIILTAPFGFGMVLVFLSCMNYLIDSYTIYAASVLAANSVLRSLFGAAFPLFTSQMYSRLGIHWASTIPAFLALACLPFPFVFYKMGERIRMKCKYAAQAHQIMQQMKDDRKREAASSDDEKETTETTNKGVENSGDLEAQRSRSLSTTSTIDDADVSATRTRTLSRSRSRASQTRHNNMVRTYTQSSHHHY
jgi:hypothetical protein